MATASCRLSSPGIRSSATICADPPWKKSATARMCLPWTVLLAASARMYLTKNNFIFISEILEHVFHVVNQMRPAFIGIQLYPFVFYKAPQYFYTIQFRRGAVTGSGT